MGNAGIPPVSATTQNLPEVGNADSIGAQLAAQDIDIQLKALAGGLGGSMPVGDYDAAEGVGLIDGHERDCIERGAPKETVNPKRAGGTPARVVAVAK